MYAGRYKEKAPSVLNACYLVEVSTETAIPLNIDTAFATLFFQPIGNENKHKDKVLQTLTHELMHHYDYYYGKKHAQAIRRLETIYKNREISLDLLHHNNPSYMIRTLLELLRCEAITVLYQYLTPQKVHNSKIANEEIIELLDELLRLIIDKGDADQPDLFNEIKGTFYSLSLTMAVTIFLARHNDLHLWKEDIKTFLIHGQTLEDMPKMKITQTNLRNAAEAIKPTNYRKFVSLYEESAKAIGLKEKQMLMTKERMKRITCLARDKNLARFRDADSRAA